MCLPKVLEKNTCFFYSKEMMYPWKETELQYREKFLNSRFVRKILTEFL